MLDVIAAKLFGFLANKGIKRLIAKILEKKGGLGLKVRIKLTKALDKTWLTLRRLICNAQCWIITYDYIITDIQKEMIKAGVKGLKEIRR